MEVVADRRPFKDLINSQQWVKSVKKMWKKNLLIFIGSAKLGIVRGIDLVFHYYDDENFWPKKISLHRPGIEPESREWESRMITITPTVLYLSNDQN